MLTILPFKSIEYLKLQNNRENNPYDAKIKQDIKTKCNRSQKIRLT